MECCTSFLFFSFLFFSEKEEREKEKKEKDKMRIDYICKKICYAGIRQTKFFLPP